ncbi:MAG: ATP phosphoribosyltransferase regulatory subunit [Paracoccaceae bacterium]|nr:ATP phosphoribosyltransferase regulatory subunit [Paracoccaceae bacterium]
MAQTDPILAETERLHGFFQSLGAESVEPSLLQPADLLLDLYGEDIRARAYLTPDPLRGDLMLRPDYTVPVVQNHMQAGATAASYTYAGKVFRKQETEIDRANEYIQVGYEIFGAQDSAQADADVFSAMWQALDGLPLRVQTGDMSVLMVAVGGLRTTDERKAALLRHIWRPQRFRFLLERYAGISPQPESRRQLLAIKDPLAHSEHNIGLRSAVEIGDRITRLHRDSQAAPISKTELDLLTGITQLRETYPNILAQLQDFAVDLPAISVAIVRLEKRLEEIEKRGIDTGELMFEASYGRTSMEYYDGFVFGFYDNTGKDFSLIATGGRYDALTRCLGNGSHLPAVGGVVRPDLLVKTRGQV